MQRLKAVCTCLLALALTACDNPQYILHPASNPVFGDVRQSLDDVANTAIISPVRMGAYLSPVSGKYFRPVLPSDSRNAIIYVYRPHSVWNAEEIQAPGFFINGQFIYGLKDNGYFWVELPAGDYVFTAQRPLAFIYLKNIFQVKLTLDGGKSYYFRYDEENRIPKPADQPDLIAAGPLLQMPDDRGLRQIEGSVLEEPGVTFALGKHPDWAAFDLYRKPKDVHPSHIEDDPTPPATGAGADLGRARRVWWNPFTWDSSY
jgi:hypothetical protein